MLGQQNAVRCVKGFQNLEEVMKGSKILHLKGIRQLGLDMAYFRQVGPRIYAMLPKTLTCAKIGLRPMYSSCGVTHAPLVGVLFDK